MTTFEGVLAHVKNRMRDRFNLSAQTMHELALIADLLELAVKHRDAAQKPQDAPERPAGRHSTSTFV